MSVRRILVFWRRFKKNRAAVLGLCLLIFIVLIALCGPYIARHSPWEIQGETFQSPSIEYPMGTDDLGRDVLSGFLHGARISLLVGIITAGGSTILGVVVGALSGFSAGRLDELLMRITEMFLVIPRFFLALILVAILGPSIWNVILAIAILAWPGTSRLVRAEFLSLRETAFVEAARSLGDTRFDLIFREMLPNALPPVIINSTLQIGYAIILEAGLSFLGLGDPSVMSWGYMLNNAQHFLGYSWHMAFFPGLGIFLTVLGLNLLGDGLNDALNPRLKGR